MNYCWRMRARLEWYNTRKKLAKRAIGSIPEETVRIARAACPKGTLAMRLRDTLAELYQDEQFAALYPVEGQPVYARWRLAIVTVLQYVEGLTDRQAADAVRERIDWKYSLGLELTDAGFDFSLLSEFRLRLLEGGAETLLLDRLVECFYYRSSMGGTHHVLQSFMRENKRRGFPRESGVRLPGLAIYGRIEQSK